jgi:hypothetical protein
VEGSTRNFCVSLVDKWLRWLLEDCETMLCGWLRPRCGMPPLVTIRSFSVINRLRGVTTAGTPAWDSGNVQVYVFFLSPSLLSHAVR